MRALDKPVASTIVSIVAFRGLCEITGMVCSPPSLTRMESPQYVAKPNAPPTCTLYTKRSFKRDCCPHHSYGDYNRSKHNKLDFK